MDLSQKQIDWARRHLNALNVQYGDLIGCYCNDTARRGRMADAVQHIAEQDDLDIAIAALPASVRVQLLTPADMEAAGWTCGATGDDASTIRSKKFKRGRLGLLLVRARSGDVVLIGAREAHNGERLAKGLVKAYRAWDRDVTVAQGSRELTAEQLPDDEMEAAGWQKVDS